MLSVPGIERDACEFSCDAVVIKELTLRATYWIYDVVERSIRVLPLVPEPLASLDPARRDGGAVHHFLDLVGCEASRQIEVRRSRTTHDVRSTASAPLESYLDFLLLRR